MAKYTIRHRIDLKGQGSSFDLCLPFRKLKRMLSKLGSLLFAVK